MSVEHPTFPRPTRSLANKVAIVTGAGAAGDGIGNARAAAILLAEDGCSVVCVDLRLDLAQRTVDMIDAERSGLTDGRGQGKSVEKVKGKGEGREVGGQGAVAMQADVTNAEDCKRIVTDTMQRFGRIDILFNSVGVGGAKGTAVDVDMVEWAKGMEINVASMVLMAKYVIPEMLKNDNGRGYRGSIVNMASVAGLRGGTPHLLYPTAKGAVVNMTRAMATHHAKDGIRVNCVCPGMVYTPMMYAGGMSEDARESRKNRSLLKTEGNGWDVGCAVRFLAGDEARWMTGVVLPVDAGATVAMGSELPSSASVNA